MTSLQFREADFQHLCQQSQYCRDIEVFAVSPALIELFDSLDMLSAEELAEIVAIYILGCDAMCLSYADAHRRAVHLGYSGVSLLYTSVQLHEILSKGLRRLEEEGPVVWKE